MATRKKAKASQSRAKTRHRKAATHKAAQARGHHKP